MPDIQEPVDFSKIVSSTDINHFHKIYTEEPHYSRRQQILAKYPQVKELFVKEWRTIPITLFLLVVHFTILYWAPSFSWPIYLFLAYFGSASCVHMIYIINHDVTHFTAVSRIQGNQLLSIVCSLSAGVPYGITFGNYHREHHKFQGSLQQDTDLPSTFEINFFRGKFLKCVWICLIPFYYALRPSFLMPQKLGRLEYISIIIVVAFDLMIYYLMGIETIKFWLLSVYLSLSVHPMAIHFISEHLEFLDEQETYSYYGWMNYLMFNVGYHNEHHDFPMIPWSQLPKLHAMCKEFYQMPSHDSYFKVWWHFVTNDKIGLWRRIQRLKKLD